MSDQADSAVMSIADLADSLIESEPEQLETEEEGQPQAAAEEAEEAPDEATEESQQEEPQEPQRHRVKVKNEYGADEERDLTLEELAQGYMLQADYSRKTQGIPQQIQQQVAQHVQQYAEKQSADIAQMQQLMYQVLAPELNQLNYQMAESDPAEYLRLQAKQQQIGAVMQQLEQARLQAENQAALAQREQQEQAIRHSIKYLNDNISGWDNSKYQQALEFGAKTYGFSKQELETVVDGRAIHLLYDAMQFRNAQKQVPQQMKKVSAAPKVIKPAAPKPNNTKSEAAKRLKTSGRVEDLAAFF